MQPAFPAAPSVRPTVSAARWGSSTPHRFRPGHLCRPICRWGIYCPPLWAGHHPPHLSVGLPCFRPRVESGCCKHSLSRTQGLIGHLKRLSRSREHLCQSRLGTHGSRPVSPLTWQLTRGPSPDALGRLHSGGPLRCYRRGRAKPRRSRVQVPELRTQKGSSESSEHERDLLATPQL